MGKHERRDHLEAIQGRYRKANRACKTRMLDEFRAVCGYQRKYAIRLPGRKKPESTPRRVGREPRYEHPQLLQVLRRIWLASDQLCGQRPKIALPLWLRHFEVDHGTLPEAVRTRLRRCQTTPPFPHGTLPEAVRTRLLAASDSALDRPLKAFRVTHPRGQCGTKPRTLLKTRIPIRYEHWDVTQPGFIETDTAAHCGNSLAGDFVWRLLLAEIPTAGPSAGPPGTRALSASSAKSRPSRPLCPFRPKISIGTAIPSTSSGASRLN